MDEMVGKPLITLFHQIPCNYIFFANFGGKRGMSSMQLLYVRGLTSMQLVCVCGL
jgi:hypothetical protein